MAMLSLDDGVTWVDPKQVAAAYIKTEEVRTGWLRAKRLPDLYHVHALMASGIEMHGVSLGIAPDGLVRASRIIVALERNAG